MIRTRDLQRPVDFLAVLDQPHTKTELAAVASTASRRMERDFDEIRKASPTGVKEADLWYRHSSITAVLREIPKYRAAEARAVTPEQSQALAELVASLEDWRPVAEALEAAKARVVSLSAARAARGIVRKTKPRTMANTGTCGVCGMNVKRDGSTRLAAHGFTLKWQTQMGTCQGWRFPPIEVSKASLEWLEGALFEHHRALQRRYFELVKIPAGEHVPHPESPSRTIRADYLATSVERERENVARQIQDVRGRIAQWQPGTLPNPGRRRNPLLMTVTGNPGRCPVGKKPPCKGKPCRECRLCGRVVCARHANLVSNDGKTGICFSCAITRRKLPNPTLMLVTANPPGGRADAVRKAWSRFHQRDRFSGKVRSLPPIPGGPSCVFALGYCDSIDFGSGDAKPKGPRPLLCCDPSDDSLWLVAEKAPMDLSRCAGLGLKAITYDPVASSGKEDALFHHDFDAPRPKLKVIGNPARARAALIQGGVYRVDDWIYN